MKAFRKIAACVVAAAALTSVAVTACADYYLSGMKADDKYCLTIGGLPQEVFNDLQNQNQGVFVTLQFVECNKAISLNTCNDVLDFSVTDQNGNPLPDELECKFVKFQNGELGFLIYFDPDDEYLAEFTKIDEVLVAVVNFSMNGDNTTTVTKSFASNGDIVDVKYKEKSAITWQPLSSTSEPTSSAPASEPTSTAPVSEPTSTAPASAPTSTATSTSTPNPTTGAGGIAFVFAAAAIAAGAVVVAAKKK